MNILHLKPLYGSDKATALQANLERFVAARNANKKPRRMSRVKALVNKAQKEQKGNGRDTSLGNNG